MAGVLCQLHCSQKSIFETKFLTHQTDLKGVTFVSNQQSVIKNLELPGTYTSAVSIDLFVKTVASP